jgi:hypothetical protein
MLNYSEKKAQYKALVEKRKTCRERQNIIHNDGERYWNPNEYELLKYDCDEINAWAQWQNSLDANILLVGQDWGIKRFL